MADKELTQAQLNALGMFSEQATKSFTTGHVINPAEQQDGAALRREFLDDQLTMLTYTDGDLEFYRDLPRRASESTVAQYDVYLKHGKVGHSRFVREIGIAPISDPSIRKKNVNMKFVSDTKQISLASGLVNNIEDPMKILTEDALTVVAKTIEWASFYGDADLSDDASPDSGLEFNGLTKLIDADNVIDAKGASLSQELLNRAAVTVGKGYGRATDAYMPIGVQADFVNTQLEKQMQIVRDNNDSVNMGFNIQGFNSARGFIRLHGSTVMELDNILDENYLPMPTAPLQPTVVATVKTAQAGQFRTADLTVQSYKVVVHSDEAESAPSAAVTGTVANATDGVELAITVNGMYQQRPQFVSIYRQGAETGLYYLIERVAMSKAVGGVITFVDKNITIPETADVFVGEMNPSVLHLFELLPMMRLPLAAVNATVTFSILWYGALCLRSPRKWVRLRNVKYLATKNVTPAY